MGAMPTISVFYGIKIQMHWTDHPPPHFHAVYANERATVNIQSLEVTKGSLPPRVISLILEWARLHESELMENWKQCERNKPPRRIPGLE